LPKFNNYEKDNNTNENYAFVKTKNMSLTAKYYYYLDQRNKTTSTAIVVEQ